MEESAGVAGANGSGGGAGVQHEDEENTTQSTMSEDEEVAPLDLPSDDVTPDLVNIVITTSSEAVGSLQSNVLYFVKKLCVFLNL